MIYCLGVEAIKLDKTTKITTMKIHFNKLNQFCAPETQILARLVWASNLCSWNNVHSEMKSAVAGLVRRGLMVRRESDNALSLTDCGVEYLESHNIPLNAAKECASVPAEKLVPTAKYWTDQWQQQIPA